MDNFPLPDWVPSVEWEMFCRKRASLGTPLDLDAARLVIDELAKLGQQGENLADVLKQSVIKGYPDVYPVAVKVKPASRAGKSTAGPLAQWWRSATGIAAMAKEVGLSAFAGESREGFTARIQAKLDERAASAQRAA